MGLAGAPVENGDHKLSVTFVSESEGPKLAITQESLSETEGIHPHQDGWESSLYDLETYLSKEVL